MQENIKIRKTLYYTKYCCKRSILKTHTGYEIQKVLKTAFESIWGREFPGRKRK